MGSTIKVFLGHSLIQFKTFNTIITLKMMIRQSRQSERNNHRERRARSCYPEMMERTTSLSRFPFREITTLTQERRKARDIVNNQFCLPNRTGDTRFHTTWSINDKGDRIWLAFDPSRPCTMFGTTETRFLKPKLHKLYPDPYEKKIN